MQYAESLHEIVIKRIHYDSRTSYDSQKCVHRVHVTQTTGYHTILTILIQILLRYIKRFYSATNNLLMGTL